MSMPEAPGGSFHNQSADHRLSRNAPHVCRSQTLGYDVLSTRELSLRITPSKSTMLSRVTWRSRSGRDEHVYVTTVYGDMNGNRRRRRCGRARGEREKGETQRRH
jgi:hypothetical protein